MPITRRQVFAGLLLMAIAATVLSLTIGRDLYAGRTPDLTSFAIVHFAGYLFFIVLPVEVLLPWYLAEGHSAVELVPLAVGTAMAAQVVDYGIGRMVSGPVVQKLIGEARLARARSTIDRWGHWAILLFNLTPLSSPNLVAAAGVVRFGLVRTMLWSTAGLVLKYVLLAVAFDGA